VPSDTAAPAGRSPATPGAAPLVLHEGVSHPGGCSRWPAGLYLRSSLGELVPGRCRATNLCEYCSRLSAVENSEMLSLDAMNGVAPNLWLCLTTRTAIDSPRPFYKARELVIRALKRRWPDVQYACQVEFTTGYGPKSGGKRRPHWNILLKGVPTDQIEEVRAIVGRVWCQHVDALPERQHVGEVHEAGGLMRYLVLHFMKESQSPPKGWRGIRSTRSRGYLWLPTPAARKAAKDSLALGRELWKAQRSGLSGQDARRFSLAKPLPGPL
jgi:hypothetical protein